MSFQISVDDGGQPLKSLPCTECKAQCLSELLGTYLLVLIGPGTVIIASLFPQLNATLALVLIGLSFGGTVAGIIMSLRAHVNPAVSIAHAFSRAMPRTNLLPFVSFQVTGGLLAGLTLRLVFSSLGSATDLGSTKLGAQINPVAGIVLESVGTFSLALVILLTSSHVHSAKLQAFLVGTTLFILILLIGPLTGASFNPARSLGPAVASGYFTDQFVYWIGPLSGGLTGASLFIIIQGYGGRKDGKTDHSLCMC